MLLWLLTDETEVSPAIGQIIFRHWQIIDQDFAGRGVVEAFN